MRIVSLLPSATDTLVALGLVDQLIGISHSCVLDRDLPRLTRCRVDGDAPARAIDTAVKADRDAAPSLYVLDSPQLAALKPDLVISQALCDVCAVSGATVEQVLAELSPRPQLVNLEPFTLDDILSAIAAIGEAAGVGETARTLTQGYRDRIRTVEARSANAGHRPRTILLDWTDPPFFGGHWTDDLIRLAGGENIMPNAGAPSVESDWPVINDLAPDICIVAACGFTAERTAAEIAASPAEAALAALADRGTAIHIVDGHRHFSNPGPLIIDSLEQLAALVHPH